MRQTRTRCFPEGKAGLQATLCSAEPQGMTEMPRTDDERLGEARPPRWLTAVVGVVCACVGGAFLSLAGWLTTIAWSRPEVDGMVYVFLAVVTAIGFPFVFLARTLVFGKGLDDASLISPRTWNVVAGIFSGIGVLLIVGLIAVQRWELIPGILPTFAFARWASIAANSRRRMQSAA